MNQNMSGTSRRNEQMSGSEDMRCHGPQGIMSLSGRWDIVSDWYERGLDQLIADVL
jgi:hypothetical protein